MYNDSPSPNEQTALPALTGSTELDAHGYDPSAYDWVPVLRRPRGDGWTPQRQVEFIAALADCGCVEQAAREVCMSATSCYRLRRAPGAENFATAWDAALVQASRRLVDLAFERAVNGSDEPVFDCDGHRVGRRMRTNDRLLMFLLRAYVPDRFRHAHHHVRLPHEEPPPAIEAVGAALLRLEPVAPAQPHLLMALDDLDTALQVADMTDGKLPHWHRGTPDIVEPPAAPLGEAFEQALAAAKRAADDPTGRLSPGVADETAVLGTPSPDLPPRSRRTAPPRQRRDKG